MDSIYELITREMDSIYELIIREMGAIYKYIIRKLGGRYERTIDAEETPSGEGGVRSGKGAEAAQGLLG